MANPRRIIDQNGAFIDDEELSPAGKQRQETIDAIHAAFNESEDDESWQIRVYRVTGANKLGMKEPWLFNCSVEELPVDQRLRDEYGSGIYKCKCYRNNVLFRSFTAEVEKTDRVAAPAASEISTILAAFQESQNRMMAILESRLAPQAVAIAPPDPFVMFERFSTMMLNMRQLSPEPAQNGMEMFTKGIELASSLQAGGGDTNLMDIVKEFVKGPAISGLLENIASKGANPGQIQNQPTYNRQITTALPSPAAPPNAQGMDQMAQIELLKNQLKFLCGQAARGSDPELWAELILDQVPQAYVNQMVNDPNIINQLSQLVPEVGNHVIWFQGLLTIIKEYATEGADDGEAARTADTSHANPGRTQGNMAHTPNDESNNKPVKEKSNTT